MPQVDLNRLAERLKQQKPVAVSRDGQLVPRDPKNDGTNSDGSGNTTLEPKRFFN